jgi:hypothetical protein
MGSCGEMKLARYANTPGLLTINKFAIHLNKLLVYPQSESFVVVAVCRLPSWLPSIINFSFIF